MLKTLSDAKALIKELLAHLPDNIKPDDESWSWCWDELSGDAQEHVKTVRRKAREFLGTEYYDG